MPEPSPVSNVLVKAFIESQRLRASPMPEIPVVSISGDLTDDVGLIQRTAMSLILTPARSVDGKQETLAPFVHLHVVQANEEAESEGGRTLMKNIVPLENAAFLVASLSADLRLACTRVSRMAAEGASLERGRLEAVRHFAAEAAHEVLSSIAWLTRALEAGEAPPSSESSVAGVRPKPVRKPPRRLRSKENRDE